MSWHFSRALVAASLGGNSSDGEPSAPSNGTPMHGTFWSPDKTTDASPPSRSGMTFRPSTASHGEAVLMWCLEVSPVRTSASQTQAEKESPEQSLGCGWRWPESSVKFDPVLHSWKTRQLSLLGGLEPFSETWPEWGMMRDGECWGQSMPELPIAVVACGLWRSPAASEPGVSGEIGDEERRTSGQHVSALRQAHRENGSDRISSTGESERNVQNTECERRSKVVESDEGGTGGQGAASEALPSTRGWWEDEPGMGRMADGVANRTHRMRCLGNGQVPAVAALAWETLRKPNTSD